MSEEKNSISVKELAAKLQVSDALLKKLVKDFGIETTKLKNRVHLEDSSVQTVREIMALRASGKKTQEIKELFDASQPEAKKTELKKEETKKDDKEKPAAKTKKDKDSQDKKKKDPKAKDSKKDKDSQDKKKKDPKAKDLKKDKESKKDDKETESKDKNKDRNKKKNNKRTRSNKNDSKNTEDDKDGLLNINEYIDGNDNDNDFKARLAVDEENDEEIIAEDFEEDFEEEDEEEEEDTKSSSKSPKAKKQKYRRRQFSYKYIQRQIINDQKRVKYIQQKLKRGRLSTKEKMQLEESLEIRDKLLAGWIKLLRWVKS